MANAFRASQCVAFDAMKTLIVPRRTIGAIYSELAYDVTGVSCDADALGRNMSISFRNMNDRHPFFGYATIGSEKWWLEVVRRTFISSNIKFGEFPHLPKHVYDYFCSGLAYRLESTAIETVDRLLAKNIRVIIISNFNSPLRQVLRHFEIDRQFYCGLFLSGELGVQKPDPRIFHMALHELKLLPGELLCVGDDVINDFECPTTIGCNALLLRSAEMRTLGDPIDWVPVNRVIHTLKDVLTFV